LTEVTILVPGFNNDATFLSSLEKALQGEGFAARSWAAQPSNGDAPLEVLAFQLAATVAATLDAGQPLNLVGFSMGGLICRLYVQRMGGFARVRRLITLATPHHGTVMAYLFQRPACYQMRPGSQFLAELNNDLAPLTQVAFTSIWTPLDLTIVPATSSLLPVGEMVQIWSPFHATLPVDPRIVSQVIATLRKPTETSDE
jgi:triacylglycerol lipase